MSGSSPICLRTGGNLKAVVDFMKMPVALSTGEYPLLTSLDQNLTAYIVESVTLNVRKDLAQTVRTVDFNGSEGVNMVRIRGLGMYWITARDTSTDVQGTVSFGLSACAPSTLLFSDDTVIGEFSRLPENLCPYLSRQAMTGDLAPSRSVDLPNLGLTSHGNLIVWIQVTSTTYLSSTGSATENRLTTYGFFASVNPRGGWGDYIAASGEDANRMYYPNIHDVISNPEYLGLQASTIQDISVSVRCPYINSGYSSGSLYMNLEKADGTTIPTNCVGPETEGVTGGKFAFYNLSDPTLITVVPLIENVTVSLSQLERASGQVIIKDHNGSAVGMVPTSWGATVNASVQCVGDHGKLLTIVTVNDVEYTIQEGHLPYVGSAWAEYIAYSMSYDRQAMENSIAYADQRMWADLATGAAGAIQGAAVSAIGGSGPLAILSGLSSFGLGAAGSMIERGISERQARDEQALSERRVQGQAGTAYSSAYGVIYCLMNLRHPALIEVDMPEGLTESIDGAYTAVHGYPAEGRRSVSLKEGFYQGRIFAADTIRMGPWFDMMNEKLSNGIRFVSV